MFDERNSIQAEARVMAEPRAMTLDFGTTFPHLAAAPIVEAVIHWQAHAEQTWERNKLREALAGLLPDYPDQKEKFAVQLALEAKLEEGAEPPVATRQGGWIGFRHSTADKLSIAQFNRDGFVFSRLRPYLDWVTFEAEARRLWHVFLDLAKPSQVSRLGVRFINRIPIDSQRSLASYLADPPACPLELPLQNFQYQSVFDVPGHNLGINVIKTVQEVELTGQVESGLILDIDVFTKRPLICDDSAMNDILPKMRWLKNAVFFTLLRPEAIETFKGA